MQHGSEEKDREEEASPQDRGGEEVVSEEDGKRPSQEEIDLQEARGSSPRLVYFPFQNKRLLGRPRRYRAA